MQQHHVAIIHGTEGHPEENWFPWLQTQLESMGVMVSVPALPTPAGQNLESWRAAFAAKVDDRAPVSVLVGHSIGASFALRLAESSETAYSGLFLASAVLGTLGLPQFDDLNSSFVQSTFDWEQIRAHSDKIFVYHGDDDPYVPESMGRRVADETGGKFELIANGGHLNAAAGFEKFEQLLGDLRGVVAEK